MLSLLLVYTGSLPRCLAKAGKLLPYLLDFDFYTCSLPNIFNKFDYTL